MAWSSGKDGALALYRSFSQGDYEIVALMTTVAENLGRVSVHGVREELLDRQSDAIALPLQKIPLPVPCPSAVYEQRWEQALAPWKAKGVEHVVFADVNVEDIRRYREQMLTKFGMKAVFPLWGQNTKSLSKEMVDSGIKSLVFSVDTRKLPASLAGNRYDAKFIAGLPPSIDPCGENGEFHTFVYNAPFFKKAIAVEVGNGVDNSGFHFADLRAPEPTR